MRNALFAESIRNRFWPQVGTAAGKKGEDWEYEDNPADDDQDMGEGDGDEGGASPSVAARWATTVGRAAIRQQPGFRHHLAGAAGCLYHQSCCQAHLLMDHLSLGQPHTESCGKHKPGPSIPAPLPALLFAKPKYSPPINIVVFLWQRKAFGRLIRLTSQCSAQHQVPWHCHCRTAPLLVRCMTTLCLQAGHRCTT